MATANENFEKLLWDNVSAVVTRAEDGLLCSKELTRFFRKRMEAEEATAQNLVKMCMAQTFGRTRELADDTHESGSVKAALAVVLQETKKTSHAHDTVAHKIMQQLVEPLEEWTLKATTLVKSLHVEAREMEKEMNDARDLMLKAQLAFYSACKEMEDEATSSTGTTETLAEKRQLKQTLQTDFKLHIGLCNKVQKRVYNAGLKARLRQLEGLEVERILLEKQAMQAFVDLTCSLLPSLIGQPVADSMMSSITNIDADADLSTFAEKNSASELPPGSYMYREFDNIRDVPAEMKSCHVLTATGGGPIHSGWLNKEGHMVKSWKKRWCVVWPRHFEKMGMNGPSFFYYEDQSSTTPKGVVDLLGMKVGVPKKARKGKEFLIRVESPEDPKGSKKDKVVVDCAGKDEMATWKSVFQAGCEAKGWKPKLELFGPRLEDIMTAQKENRPTLDCSVPLHMLIMVDRLSEMGVTHIEGAFRIPGDSDYMKQLKGRFEAHETAVADKKFDVHVWASTLKLWCRSLKEPLITDAVYDECIAIADTASAGGAVEPAKVLQIISKLSPTRQDVINHICQFLKGMDVEASKMSVENLAIVFAPCLLRHEDLMVAMKNTSKEIAFTTLLLMATSKLQPSARLLTNTEAVRKLCELPRKRLLTSMKRRDAQQVADGAQPEPELGVGQHGHGGAQDQVFRLPLGQGALGMSLHDDAVITGVERGSHAEKAGLQVGMRVVAVNGTSTSHKMDVAVATKAANDQALSQLSLSVRGVQQKMLGEQVEVVQNVLDPSALLGKNTSVD